jgi:hypothetical protein
MDVKLLARGNKASGNAGQLVPEMKGNPLRHLLLVVGVDTPVHDTSNHRVVLGGVRQVGNKRGWTGCSNTCTCDFKIS